MICVDLFNAVSLFPIIQILKSNFDIFGSNESNIPFWIFWLCYFKSLANKQKKDRKETNGLKLKIFSLGVKKSYYWIMQTKENFDYCYFKFIPSLTGNFSKKKKFV